MISAGRKLSIATWNIAAINNNPFEYWITYKENPKYEELMAKVEHFLENPGSDDVAVSSVFTESMFSQLDTRFKDVGWKSVRSYWEGGFCLVLPIVLLLCFYCAAFAFIGCCKSNSDNDKERKAYTIAQIF